VPARRIGEGKDFKLLTLVFRNLKCLIEIALAHVPFDLGKSLVETRQRHPIIGEELVCVGATVGKPLSHSAHLVPTCPGLHRPQGVTQSKDERSSIFWSHGLLLFKV
jgi:hypothetical protein